MKCNKKNQDPISSFNQKICAIKDKDQKTQILKKLGYDPFEGQFPGIPKKKICINASMKYPYFTLSGIIPNIFGKGENFEFKLKKNFLSLSFIKPLFNSKQEISFLELKTFQTKKNFMNEAYPIDGITLKKESRFCNYKLAVEKIYKNYVSYVAPSFSLAGINFKAKIGSVHSSKKISPFLKIVSDVQIQRRIKLWPIKEKNNSFREKSGFFKFLKEFPGNLKGGNNVIHGSVSITSHLSKNFIDSFIDFAINQTFRQPWLVKKLIKIQNFFSKKPQSSNANCTKELPHVAFSSKIRNGVVFGKPHPLDTFILGRNISGYPENSIGPVENNNVTYGNSFIEIKNKISINFKNFEVFAHSDVGFCGKTKNILETAQLTLLSMMLEHPCRTFGASFGVGASYLFPKIKNVAPKIGISYSIPVTNVENNEKFKFNLDLIS